MILYQPTSKHLLALSGELHLTHPRGGVIDSPDDVPGLVLWLQADTGTWQDAAKTVPADADADTVYVWEDQSGEGNDASQATANDRPEMQTRIGDSSVNVVRFDGADHFLDVGTIRAAEGELDCYVISRRVYQMALSGDKYQRVVSVWDGASANDFTDPSWTVFPEWDGSGDPVAYSADIRYEYWPDDTTLVIGDVRVGHRRDAPASGRFRGDIYEILIYNRELSATQHDAIITYLNSQIAGLTDTTSTGTWSDNFNDNSLDTSVWSATAGLHGASTASVDEQNNRLEMSMTDVTGQDHTYVHTNGNILATGDFDARVDFDLLTHSDVDQWHCFLTARSVERNGSRAWEEVRASIEYDGGGNRQYGGEIRCNGVPTVLDGTGSYVNTADTSGELRIVRSGGTASAYYWNGVDWTLLESDSIGSDDMYIMLWISSGDGNLPDIEVAFDNFTLT